jgi:hypothetical protein
MAGSIFPRRRRYSQLLLVIWYVKFLGVQGVASDWLHKLRLFSKGLLSALPHGMSCTYLPRDGESLLKLLPFGTTSRKERRQEWSSWIAFNQRPGSGWRIRCASSIHTRPFPCTTKFSRMRSGFCPA